MVAAAKVKIPGMTITTAGEWRCNNCARATLTTPVCSGVHDDGSPNCGKAVCTQCADRCVRCNAYLCPDCFKRSQDGWLCVQCPAPAEGREAYLSRQRARAAMREPVTANRDNWRSDTDRAHRASAEAQQSVDDAMKRAAEIERSLNEMKARMRKTRDGSQPQQP